MKNSIGPKIRHPSGVAVPSIIFKKEKHDSHELSNAAKLYQTILEFPISRLNSETFKITNMCYWVLDQNEDYKNYYAGFNSKIRKSIRLESVSKRIKRYLDNLIQWGLIERVEEVDPNTRNGLKTFLYCFTYVGYIIAFAIQYYSIYNALPKLDKSDKLQSLRVMKKIKDEIFEYVKRLFLEFNSCMTYFLLGFYAKCREFDISNQCPFVTPNEVQIGIGLFDQIILALVRGLNNGNFRFPSGIECLSVAHTYILTNKETAFAALKLYFMALDEFPENEKKLIMTYEKTQIEYEFIISQPSEDWGKVWYENRSNHENLVLYSVCRNKDCKTRRRPVLMPYRLYRRKLVTASRIINYNDGFPPMRSIVLDCPTCKPKNSTDILDSFVNVRRMH